jgi:hypothetical protein
MSGKREVWSRSGPQRLNYFYGRLLNAEDFQMEQEYHRDKLRQLTRVVLGIGVVEGLRVSCTGRQVTVSAGVAVDSLGRLMELYAPCRFALPVGVAAWHVYIGMEEVLCGPQLAPLPDAGEDKGTGFGRIEEVTKVWVEEVTARSDTVATAAVWLGLVRARKVRAQGAGGGRKKAKSVRSTGKTGQRTKVRRKR